MADATAFAGFRNEGSGIGHGDTCMFFLICPTINESFDHAKEVAESLYEKVEALINRWADEKEHASISMADATAFVAEPSAVRSLVLAANASVVMDALREAQQAEAAARERANATYAAVLAYVTDLKSSHKKLVVASI